MKRVLGWAIVVAALALALGFWFGIRANRSAALSAGVEVWLAIVIGGNFLFSLWLWYRARSGSGDAAVAPVIALMSAAMLVGILPPLLWPAEAGVRIAGSIASIVATAAALLVLWRRRRRFRTGE